jgi:hypothetical protein
MKIISRGFAAILATSTALLLAACASGTDETGVETPDEEKAADGPVEEVATASQALAGSWYLTCYDNYYYVDYDMLCATCRKKNGSYVRSCYRPAASCNTMTNCDGSLVCRSRC